MTRSTKNPSKPEAPDHAARGHHPYSPSTLQYLEASPAFIGVDSENDASKAGTLQHEAVESGNFDELTDEQVDKVEFCRARKLTIKDELAEAAGCKPEEILELTEQYLPIDQVKLKDGTEGTTAGYLDYGLVTPCRQYAAIVDWKFGQWRVTEAQDNLQGMGYMLGLFRKFPTIQACHVEFQMPHIGWETAHVFEAGDRAENYSAIYGRIRRVVDKAVEARMAAKAGQHFECTPRPMTCSFCARIGTCPYASELFGGLSAKLNEALHLPAQLNAHLMKKPEEVATAIRFANTAEVWAKALRRELSQKALDDAKFIPPDYSLQIRNDRVLINPEPIEAELKRMGATDEEIEATYKTSITELGKVARKHTPRGKKDEVEKALMDAAEEAGHIGREPETKVYLQAKRTKSDE